jgi:hypothetical protein
LIWPALLSDLTIVSSNRVIFGNKSGDELSLD